MSEPVIVDWARRRVLRLAEESTARACHHGSRLSEWCSDCNGEVDALALDLTA